MECLRLRVQDIDFSRNEIMVSDGKGAKDRITMLPELIKKPLQDHLRDVKAIHEKDLSEGWGRILMPDAFRPQVSERPNGLALAVGLSAGEPLEEHDDQPAMPPPCTRNHPSSGRQRCGSQSECSQACGVPHVPPFVRHSFA